MQPRDELVLWYTSDGLDPGELLPGRDLVLNVELRHGLVLPPGCAMADHIPLEERAAVDAHAHNLAATWRDVHGDGLRLRGVDLAFAWEVELFAGCFLPAARIQDALRVCVKQFSPRRVIAKRFPPDLVAVISASLADGVEVTLADPQEDLLWRSGSRNALISRAFAHFGVPPRLRSDVLAASYWPLIPVTRRLTSRGSGLVPAAAGVALPGLDPRRQLRGLARGGWIGYPNAVAKARAGRLTLDLLKRAAAGVGGRDLLEDALQLRAIGLLRRLAMDSLAQALHIREAFSRRVPRLVLVPFDSPASPRLLLAEAHAAGACSLLVQHGFNFDPNDPDKSLARHSAIWSKRDRASVLTGEPHVTGNPGAAHLRQTRSPATSRPCRTIVLPEYTPRLGTLQDGRVPLRHLQAALDGVAAARPNTTVVLRPHPGDPDPFAYPRLVTVPDRIQLTTDRSTPIEELFAGADMCVGALSTASLQAAAIGLPVCVLNVSGVPRPWPFAGGEDPLPQATSAEELAEQIPELLLRGPGPSREAALEALGARADAVQNVVGLVRELAAR